MGPADVKWWVYVLRSHAGRTYVGSTTDPPRRLRQHNGEIRGGAKCTRGGRPWALVKVYGPYAGRPPALRAELSLKKGKRGDGRTRWCAADSPHFCDSPEAAEFTQNSCKNVDAGVSEGSKRNY